MHTLHAPKKLTLLYSLVQGGFWINSAIVVGYASIFLLDCGISNSQIGILFALSGLISSAVQPLVGSYADKPSSPSVKRIILYLCFFTIVIAAFLCFSRWIPTMLSSILYCICLTSFRVLLPLVNALGTESVNQGFSVNMGLARGIGSVVYAGAATLMGFLTLRCGNRIIPVCVLFGFLLLCIFTLLFPFRKTEILSSRESVSDSSERILKLFRRYPDFPVFLAGSVLIYIALEMMANFQYQIVADRGGNSFDLGRIMSFCAVCELPALFLFSRLLKKKTCDFWVRLSAFFIVLKCLGLLLSQNVTSILAVQLLQSLGWAVYTIAPVYYVNSILPSRYAVRGQTCFNMSFTLGTTISSLIGGQILEKASPDSMLLVITIVGFAGALLIFFFTRRNVE